MHNLQHSTKTIEANSNINDYLFSFAMLTKNRKITIRENNSKRKLSQSYS